MDSAEYSRKVAEAMGWRECANPHAGWDEDTWHQPDDPAGCGENCWVITVPLLDLADARDREAVIAWLNAKGLLVVTAHYPDGTAGVDISKRDGTELARFTRPTIEEAFGRAFLKAVEAVRE